MPRDGKRCSRKRIHLVCQASRCQDASEGTVPPPAPPPASLSSGTSGKVWVRGKAPSSRPKPQLHSSRDGLLQPSSFSQFKGLSGDILPEQPRGLSHQTGQHREQRDTRATSSHFPVSVFVLPLCLAKYRPKMMSRQSIANTTTATTPPTTAWSTLRIAPSSPARESVEIRRGIRIRDLLRRTPKGLAAAALRIGKATLVLSTGQGVKHGAIQTDEFGQRNFVRSRTDLAARLVRCLPLQAAALRLRRWKTAGRGSGEERWRRRWVRILGNLPGTLPRFQPPRGMGAQGIAEQHGNISD